MLLGRRLMSCVLLVCKSGTCSILLPLIGGGGENVACFSCMSAPFCARAIQILVEIRASAAALMRENLFVPGKGVVSVMQAFTKFTISEFKIYEMSVQTSPLLDRPLIRSPKIVRLLRGSTLKVLGNAWKHL